MLSTFILTNNKDHDDACDSQSLNARRALPMLEATEPKSVAVGSGGRLQLVSQASYSSFPLPSATSGKTTLTTMWHCETSMVAQYPTTVDHVVVPAPPEPYHLPPIENRKQPARPPSLPNLIEIYMDVPGTRFGLFEWPEDVPQRILDLLAEKSPVKGVKPLPKDFSNSRGLLCCPLCPRIKEYARLIFFTKHLWKH